MTHNDIQQSTNNKPPITISAPILDRLYQHGIIDAEGYQFAQQHFLPKLHWQQWLFRLSVGLGAALLLIGIVFFFAYNWHAMPQWSKLALIEGTMILCVVLAAVIGVKKFLGQSLLLAASVFVGVFFAVFGQIYQTGADAWQLFALWAVLIIGVVGISQFIAQWILQWSITGLALLLFMKQTIYFYEFWAYPLIMALYTIGIWVLQRLLSRKYHWLDNRWLRVLTLFIAHICLLVFVIVAFSSNLFIVWLSAGIAGILLWWHYSHGKDLLAQVIGVATIGIIIWGKMLEMMLYRATDFVGITFMMLFVTIGISMGIYSVVGKLKQNYETKVGSKQ